MSDIRARIEKLIGPRPPWHWTDDQLNDWFNDLINQLAKDAKIWITKDEQNTYVGLDIQPIKRGVTKAEIIDHLRIEDKARQLFGMETNLTELIRRIESEGILDE